MMGERVYILLGLSLFYRRSLKSHSLTKMMDRVDRGSYLSVIFPSPSPPNSFIFFFFFVISYNGQFVVAGERENLKL